MNNKMQVCPYNLIIAVMLTTLVATNCNSQEEAAPKRRPRPVTVAVLKKQPPPNASLITASAGSWKVEQIGFEVGGRVEFVAEPNTEIEGRIFDKSGKLIVPGTPIGRLESERYRIQVGKARAEVARAEQTLLAAQIDLDESIPAQISAATATRDLTKTEFERAQELFSKDFGTELEFIRSKVNYESAEAQLKQLNATRRAKSAEIESLKNSKLQAEQDLRDAERNLEDCTLYSSFRGQIADISVVPGSVVSAGQSIATLQMMDPIKIEFEVSTEVSRQLQDRESLPVVINMPNGTVETHEAYVYLIDSVADPRTRTFTVTLLMTNKQIASIASDSNIATTRDIWRLDFKFLSSVMGNRLCIEENALLQDSEGYYLWMITNLTIQTLRTSDQNLKVRKLRVAPGSFKVPFLGNWVFQDIEVNDEDFDPKVNVVVGELQVSGGEAAEWNGDTVIRSTGSQWMLRPGDLVRVDLTEGNGIDGYYVPMNAIIHKYGQTYIFVVTRTRDQSLVRKKTVRLIGDRTLAVTSSLLRVESTDGSSLDGVRYVVDGVHYLIDGEQVHVKAQSGIR